VYHLLDLTIGTVNPAFQEGDVYANLLGSLQRPLIAVFYLAAMAALALHLYHGAWSSMRSLGVAQATPSPLKRRAAVVIAVIVAVGFAVVPLAVLFGVIR
jgi:succinate dehydrogenase / fumarate reductase cytochrome b subunit